MEQTFKNLPIKLSESISLAFHPIIIIIGLYTISLFIFKFSALEKISISIFQLFIPLGIFSVQIYRKKIDLDLNDHKTRVPLLMISLISFAIGSFIIYIGGYQQELKLQLGIFLATLIFTLITIRWKISFHSFMITVGMIFLYRFFGSLFLYIGLILVPLVMATRLILKKHTLLQTIAGTALGLSLLIFF